MENRIAKTVLIPTDFSYDSLMQLKPLLDENTFGNRVIFFHCMFLSDSISDLLFYSPRTIMDSELARDFQQACREIHLSCREQITSIRIELFHGVTHGAFSNLLESNGVNEIYFPKRYILKKHKNSFNPMPFILKNGTKRTAIEWESADLSSIEAIKEELFPARDAA